MYYFILLNLFFLSSCYKLTENFPLNQKSSKKIAEESSAGEATAAPKNLSTIAIRSESDDLLPSDKNPAEAYVKLCPNAGFNLSQELIDIFNNFDSTAASKRHYNFVSFLDGLTIGMGHWPQAEAKYFFSSMNKDSNAKESFIKEGIKALKERPEKECKSYLSNKKCESKNIRELIESTLFSPIFLKEKYSKNCKLDAKYHCASGPNLFYDMPWVKFVLKRSLRDRVVTNWQVGFFDRDIIASARNKAKISGLQNKSESILIFSSFESSFKSYATKLMKVGKENTYLDFGGEKYYWSKPEGIKNPTADQLQSWRMLMAFRWYQYIKGSRAKRPSQKGCNYPLRDRQHHLYCKFLKKSWDKYWPDAPLGAKSCGKITDRISKMGGCTKILARESVLPNKCVKNN